MSTTTTATLAAVVLLPLALGFAGHAPVAGPAGLQPVISTTLAQADADDAGGDAAQAVNGSEELQQDVNRSEIAGIELSNRQLVINYEGGGAEQERRSVVRFIDNAFNQSDVKLTGDGSGLDQDVNLNFTDAPLLEVLWLAQQVAGVNIVFDEATLQLAGVSNDTPVTIQVSDVSLRNALNLILKPLGLGWTFDGATVQVSTLDQLKEVTAESAAAPQPAAELPATETGIASAPDGIRNYADAPASEQKIADALQQPTQVEFVDTPLSDAIDFLATQNDITIVIDETALTDAGIPTDEPVNMILDGVTLQTVMNHMLRRLDCTTIIRDEVLEVTTKEVADEYLVTRVYDISDLAGLEQEQLLKVLQESLPDAEWKDTGGGGGTASILDDALVVKQSQSAHRQIVDLLGQLRRHLQQRSQSSDSQTYEDSRSGKAAEASRGRIVGKVSGRRTGHTKNVEDVEVPIGSEEGLREGDELVIYSSSGSSLKPIARVRVYEVTPHTARAHVFSQVDGTEIQMGDSVGLDPIFGRELTPQGGPGAAEAADSELNPGSHELTLQIEADGRARYDGRPVSIVQLQELLQKEQPSLLILRVDRSASSQAVSDIVEAAKAAGNPGMKFAMRGVDPNAAAPASTHEPE